MLLLIRFTETDTPLISTTEVYNTTQKMKSSIKDFSSKSSSHLLNKSLMENFIFCAVQITLKVSPQLINV